MTEHKALGENAQKPGNTMQCVTLLLATFHHTELSHSKRSKCRAFYKATLQSRDSVSAKDPPVDFKVFYNARTFSNQSKSICDVMRLGGVLVP